MSDRPPKPAPRPAFPDYDAEPEKWRYTITTSASGNSYQISIGHRDSWSQYRYSALTLRGAFRKADRKLAAHQRRLGRYVKRKEALQ